MLISGWNHNLITSAEVYLLKPALIRCTNETIYLDSIYDLSVKQANEATFKTNLGSRMMYGIRLSEVFHIKETQCVE